MKKINGDKDKIRIWIRSRETGMREDRKGDIIAHQESSTSARTGGRKRARSRAIRANNRVAGKRKGNRGRRLRFLESNEMKPET